MPLRRGTKLAVSAVIRIPFVRSQAASGSFIMAKTESATPTEWELLTTTEEIDGECSYAVGGCTTTFESSLL